MSEIDERIDDLKRTHDGLDTAYERLALALFDVVGAPDLTKSVGEQLPRATEAALPAVKPSMLDRLKEARYRRRFGPERGALVFRMEREIRGLPAASLSRAWIEWFWRQPPDTWEEAIERRRRGERLPEEPSPDSLTPEESASVIESMRAKDAEIMAALERGASAFDGANGRIDRAALVIEKTMSAVGSQNAGNPNAEARPPSPNRFKEASDRIAQACDAMGTSIQPPPTVSCPARWQDWIETLPRNAREEAIQIRTLFAMMERLQRTMSSLMEARKASTATPETITEISKRIEVLRPWVRACHREYEELAEPFFERHGRPDLTEG